MADRERSGKPAKPGGRGVRLWEAVVLAVIVGVASYAAGLRNGVKTEQRRAERAMAGESAHAHDEGMGEGMGESPGPVKSGGMPEMSKEELKERLADFGVEELVNIGNQHLDEARAGGEGQDPEGAHRRFLIAAAAYETAIAKKPNDPNLITDLGIALRGLGDSEGAVARFREAAKADAKHPQSRFNLGLVLSADLKRNDEAIAAWEDYLRIAPKGDPSRATVEKELKKLKG
jgi:tetratricopeptide (TPR) repeat protein